MKQRIAFVVAVLAVGAGIFLGFVDLDKVNMGFRRVFFQARGEVMKVGVTPNQMGNVAQAQQCRAILQRLSAAKRQAAQNRGQAVGTVSWEEVMRAMYPRENLTPARMQQLMPRCPGGGTYTLGTLEVVPKCSIGGNSSLAADDDHMILN